MRCPSDRAKIKGPPDARMEHQCPISRRTNTTTEIPIIRWRFLRPPSPSLAANKARQYCTVSRDRYRLTCRKLTIGIGSRIPYSGCSRSRHNNRFGPHSACHQFHRHNRYSRMMGANTCLQIGYEENCVAVDVWHSPNVRKRSFTPTLTIALRKPTVWILSVASDIAVALCVRPSDCRGLRART